MKPAGQQYTSERKTTDFNSYPRQRLTYLGWMQRATGIAPLELIRRCKNREEDMIVANVRI